MLSRFRLRVARMPLFSMFYIDLVVKSLCFIVSMLVVYFNAFGDVACSAVTTITILECVGLSLQVLLRITEQIILFIGSRCWVLLTEF